MSIKIIESDFAPKPNGHYPQGVTFKDLIFTSAQLPINTLGKSINKNTIEEQANVLFENLFSIVKEGGGNKETILKVTIYVTDMKYWNDINSVYTKKFGINKPARSVLNVSSIHLGFNVSAEMIAYKLP